MLFKKIIAIYIENHKKHINVKCSVSNCKADGMYSYHSALKAYAQEQLYLPGLMTVQSTDHENLCQEHDVAYANICRPSPRSACRT
jgi:hypothetical protein